MQESTGTYDLKRAGWSVSCASKDNTLIQLTDMRQLNRLEGASAPAVYLVDFFCPECDTNHQTLLGQDALDWEPIMGIPGVFLDLKSGVEEWDPAMLSEPWISAMQKGRWPLNFGCACCDQIIPGWPSQLRKISPDRDKFLVARTCSRCGEMDIETLSQKQMALMPI